MYQTAVTAAGLVLWSLVVARLAFGYGWRQQLVFLALVPLTVIIGKFIHTFQLPSGLRFTAERISFSLADAIVLLIACWHGLAPAVFVAGIEGFTSARRTSRRLSSNLFSSSMMSLGAAAAALSLKAVLHYGFGQPGVGMSHPILPVAVAIFAASVVQFVVNLVLLSTLLAVRHSQSIVKNWVNFLWTAPMFLPTGTAASLMYLALQYDIWVMLVLGGPVLLAIHWGHRQYRDSVQKRIAIMEKAHRETIEALAVAINAKDEVTHEHVLRVQVYAAGVARLLGCTSAEIEALKAGALLHDIGKIAVPDYILTKPGKLTAAEFEKMKLHTIYGAQILSRVEFPYPIVPVVRHHHERWDGRGYPDGLVGESIPLTARILSVVDCFDALRADRQYRKGLTREEATKLIVEGSGTQYDPHVVETFLAHLPEFELEVKAYRDLPALSFSIEPVEQLSESARAVPPAAGLAEAGQPAQPGVESGANDLAEMTGALGRARGEQAVLAAFTGQLAAVLPFDLCAITLAAPDTNDYVITHAAGARADLIRGRRIEFGEGVTGWALANCLPFGNTDPKLDFPPGEGERFADLRTLAVCPIRKGEKLLGAVTVYSAALAQYDGGHQQLMEKSADLLATTLLSQAAAPPAARPPMTEVAEAKLAG